MQIRQGDVLLVPVKELPKDAVQQTATRVTIAGERTGHAHVLKGQVFSAGPITLIRIPKAGAVITHQEHAHLPVPVGLYEVRIQREYNGINGPIARGDRSQPMVIARWD